MESRKPFPSVPASTEGHPRLLYYIVREDGRMIPLIAADELPSNVNLRGVPRELKNVYGLHRVGDAPSTGRTWGLLEGANMQRVTSPSGTCPNCDTTGASSSIIYPQATLTNHAPGYASNSIPRPNAAYDTPTWRNPAVPSPAKDGQAFIDSLLKTEHGSKAAVRMGYDKHLRPLPPSGKHPNQDKKIYCTFWINNGRCDYQQQGCMFKHEMPTPEILKTVIGTDRVPLWYRESHPTVRPEAFGPRTTTSGGRMTAGPVVSVATWLGKDRDSERRNSSISNSESEASVEEARPKTIVRAAETTTATSTSKTAHMASIIKPVASTTTLSNAALNTQPADIARVPSVVPAPVPKKVTNTSLAPATVLPRKAERNQESAMEELLINFVSEPVTPALSPNTMVSTAVALAPLPTTSTTFPSKLATTTASAARSPLSGSNPDTPISTPSSSVPSPIPSTRQSTRVFVPAGESPAPHVAEHKRRERRTTPKTTSPVPLRRRRAQSDSKKSFTGLMTSKHAPKEGESVGKASSSNSEHGKQRQQTLRPRVPKGHGGPIVGGNAVVLASGAVTSAAGGVSKV